MSSWADLNGGPTAFESGSQYSGARKMTATERERVWSLGQNLAAVRPGVWMLISGEFTAGNGEKSTEGWIEELLRTAFGYPDWGPAEGTEPSVGTEDKDAVKTSGDVETSGDVKTGEDGKGGDPAAPAGASAPGIVDEINVLVDSPGGNLDSAYTTVLYLSAYTKRLNVYVPNRAKSASTLLAVGADSIHLSPFGELGPLDTQIPDPRNPAKMMSALDCYQSVDYVQDFGSRSIKNVLPMLVEATERRISVGELLTNATNFALGAISPSLRSVTALDFGGWGRSLRIGEHYALKLLLAKMKDGDKVRVQRISHDLVYGYTHHLFPIDYHEADRLGLPVTKMRGSVYEKAIQVVKACHKKDFVAFLSEPQVAETKALYDEEQEGTKGRQEQSEENLAETVMSGHSPIYPLTGGTRSHGHRP